MEVKFNKLDELNATLTISLGKEDYEQQLENQLKKYQKQVAVKGFRPGKAPMGMIKNVYGKTLLYEEVNKIATQALSDYLINNKIDILAQPMESIDTPSELDFENSDSFLYAFDLGLAPIFELNLDTKTSLNRYTIEANDKSIDEEIESLRKRYGNLEDIDSAQEQDVIYAIVTELNEESQPFEGGVTEKEISLTPELIKDEATKKQLVGITKQEKITLDIFKLFNDNVAVIGNSLGIAKEAVNDLNKNFSFTVTEIKRRILADLNQDFFDMVLGQGQVSNEEEFRNKIAENIKIYYDSEAEQLLEHEINHVVTDNHSIQLPDNFLKRWLLTTKSEEYNETNIEERYQSESVSLRFMLVQEKIVEKYELKVDKEDIDQTALGYTAQLFRSYGISNPDYNMVKEFADKSLKKEDFVRQMHDIAMRRQVINKIKELITIKEKKVDIEEFYKHVNEHRH